MVDFVEVDESVEKVVKRKLVHGFGVVDVGYKTYSEHKGKTLFCPYYSVWKSMIKRCYSEKALRSGSSYMNCIVCDEWSSLKEFKSWMELQDWRGNFLDKDIISDGSRIYSSDTCCFVSRHLNNFVQDRRRNSTGLPVGVFKCPNSDNFYSRRSLFGVCEHIGVFSSALDARDAYIGKKIEDFENLAISQSDQRIGNGLALRAEKLKLELTHAI